MIKIVKGEKYLTELRTNKVVLLHRKNIKKAFHNYGSDITKELKRVIETGPRTGRVYIVKGIAHQASAPGEPPANQTGKLADSFNYKARMMELIVFSTAFSKEGAPYPRYLDEGTKKKKMKPRPYFNITNEQNAYKLERDLQNYDL
jgi:hypothetical protein